MFSLPARVWELAPQTSSPDAPKTPAPDVPSPAPEGWQQILFEGFEGAFPYRGWTVLDTSNDGYERYWDDDDYRPYTGSWAAWPANGGANWLDPQFSDYAPNMDTWMIYGPFDLSYSSDARTVFNLWREIESGFDFVFFGVSADGINFSGFTWDGNANWENHTVSYTGWVGDSSVWVGWYCHSDRSVEYEGPWIDDISIERNVVFCGPYAQEQSIPLLLPEDGTWGIYPLETPHLDQQTQINTLSLKIR